MYRLFTFLVLLSTLVQAQVGPWFVLFSDSTVSTQRIDPIINPGQIPSQHIHDFLGANAVSADMTFETLQSQTTCSSFGAKADKSSYWHTTLYFHDKAANSYTQIPVKQRKLYYSYQTFSNEKQNVTEFPPGFRMVAGDNSATTEAEVPTCTNTICGYHFLHGTALRWRCMGPGSDFTSTASPGFPKGTSSCPGGLQATLMFPDCWNGQQLDTSAPNAHMAYSNNELGLAGCPSTHNHARFPQLFAEINYDTSNFRWTSTDSPFVLSFGDTTGYAFHMDFLNGWNPGVLNKVMATCRQGDNSNPINLSGPDCFGQEGAGGMYTAAEAAGCKSGPTANRKLAVEASNSALPGCQTLIREGEKVELRTCEDTVPTTEDGTPNGVAVTGKSAVVPTAIKSEAPVAVQEVKTKAKTAVVRVIGGQGRAMEVEV